MVLYYALEREEVGTTSTKYKRRNPNPFKQHAILHVNNFITRQSGTIRWKEFNPVQFPSFAGPQTPVIARCAWCWSRGGEALRKFGGDRCRLLANDMKASQITVKIKTVGGKTDFWPKPQKPELEVIFHTFDPITTTNTLHSLCSGLFASYFSTLPSPTLKFLR